MVVLLADRRLSVRHAIAPVEGGHGDEVPAGWLAADGPWPGRAIEGPDVPFGEIGGRTWTIAVDTRGWPMSQGDLVIDADSGEEWLVTSADLLTNNADTAVDYIRVDAHAYATGTKP